MGSQHPARIKPGFPDPDNRCGIGFIRPWFGAARQGCRTPRLRTQICLRRQDASIPQTPSSVDTHVTDAADGAAQARARFSRRPADPIRS